jgi:predicted nucleotidyltransferase
MTLLETLHTHRDELLAIGQRYGVSNIRVFGSVARGEEREDSDIDLLVTLAKERDYFDLGGFQNLSSVLLHRKVDVVVDDCIMPSLQDSILMHVRHV